MEDKLEILVSVDDKPNPYEVRFEELYAIKDTIKSIMFLWNAGSLYVDCVSNTFIIHGGRRIRFPEMGKTKIEYRKRSSVQMSTAGGQSGPKKDHVWLVGLRCVDIEDKVLLVEIDKTGTQWKWVNVI